MINKSFIYSDNHQGDKTKYHKTKTTSTSTTTSSTRAIDALQAGGGGGGGGCGGGSDSEVDLEDLSAPSGSGNMTSNRLNSNGSDREMVTKLQVIL